jgi:hypothetical protein
VGPIVKAKSAKGDTYSIDVRNFLFYLAKDIDLPESAAASIYLTGGKLASGLNLSIPKEELSPLQKTNDSEDHSLAKPVQ